MSMFPILKFIYAHQKYKSIKIKISSKYLNAIVADTFIKALIGLMFRKKLGKNECMLFLFKNKGRHSIWMKNMLFNIDIIWLDKDKKIIEYLENIPKCTGFNCKTYGISADSKYFIEFNSGFIKKNKINKMTKIIF